MAIMTKRPTPPEDNRHQAAGRIMPQPPAATGQAVGTPEKTRETGAAPTPEPTRRVLIAEDTEVMAKLLTATLERLGCSADVATDGKKAVKLVQENRYDLIMMDIAMPRLDGLGATRMIRRLPGGRGDMPIIAVSTKMSGPEIESYLAVGMTDVIKKPVNGVSLQALFDKHLNKEDGGMARRATARDGLNNRPAPVDELDILNWDTLNSYSALFKSGMIGILQDFIRAAPDLLIDMGKAVQQGERSKIRMFADQLKSTSEVFGAEMVSDLAAQLELIAENGDTRRAPLLFGKLKAAYTATESALRKKLVLLQNMG